MHPQTVPAAQAARFTADMTALCGQICPQYGVDPAACVHAAQNASAFGMIVLGHNYWNIQGVGDAGYVETLRPVADSTAIGGMRGEGERMAKFKSPESACRAWCEIQRRERQ